MADVFELQLALDLPGTLPPRELALLHWHLGHEDGEQDGTYAYEYPLWGERGPARRLGGLQLAELQPSGRGWSLTVRQEVHPDSFTDLRAVLQWLGARTTTVGPIGHIRFYEEHVPAVLIADSGTVSCVSLKVDRVVEVGSEDFPHC